MSDLIEQTPVEATEEASAETTVSTPVPVALQDGTEVKLPTQVLMYRSGVVMTTGQAAVSFACKPNNITNNFKRNKDRFMEGRHFHHLVGDDLRAFRNQIANCDTVPKNAAELYLWTERGIARHAKMLNTERAWDVFEVLEDTYFKVRAGGLVTPEQVARLVDARMTPLVTCVTDLTRAVQSMLTARMPVRNPGVMTVEEYTHSLGRRLTDGERSQVGRIASGLSRQAGIEPRSLAVPGSVKRTVHEYPLRFLVPALAEFDARRQVRKQTTHSPDFVESCIEEDACRAKIGRPPIHTKLVREFEEQQRAKAKAKVKSGHRKKEASGDGTFDV